MWSIINGRFCQLINAIILNISGVKLGRSVKICGAFIFRPGDGRLEIGCNFFANNGLLISNNRYSPIFIGDDVMFGYDVKVLGGNHDYTDNSKHMRYVTAPSTINRPINVGSGSWVGSNVTILSGADLGEGCVIGAGSVVNSKIPPYTIACGSPARVVKLRFKSKTDLEDMLLAVDSRLNADEIITMHECYDLYKI
ncbi:acyltransferase [Vibrio vulnificus]|nr:acyltransferase [Vibrio vulnificus]EKA6052225.1 acyltransferase [Vibrio vulnificus]ELB7645892.1 acyltransferase [Vibrio vulnificus]